MRNLPLPCQCRSEVEVIRANDVEGVTEYMCRGCGEFYPVLGLGESWEPWDNETANAYAKRCGSYHARVSTELPQANEASPLAILDYLEERTRQILLRLDESWQDSWE